MQQKKWCVFSGIIWLIAAFFLARKGLFFFSEGSNWAWAFVGLFLGAVKGFFVLQKRAQKQLERIQELGSALSWKTVYPVSYYLLILGMIGLGRWINMIDLSFEVRGTVDIAIATALSIGSIPYFRGLFS